MQEAAETFGDEDLVIVGHSIAVRAYMWLGDLIKTQEHVNRVLALYSEELHGHLVGILNQDPKTFSLVCSAISIWVLGYPDRAAQIIADGEAHARKLGHPFDLAWVLTCVGPEFFDHIRQPDEMMKRVEEGDRLARESSLPFWTECMVPIHFGIALIG